MKNDTTALQVSLREPASQAQAMGLLLASSKPVEVSPQRGPGRKALVHPWHLCLAVLLCMLHGLHTQWEVWRTILEGPLGPFERQAVSDQAIYNRLACLEGTMRAFFEQVSAQLRSHLPTEIQRPLAPFASAVLALDESTLDQLKKWLPPLRRRRKPSSSKEELAGRICGLFDVRAQQWVRIELSQDAKANCKKLAPEMIKGLIQGTLLLFDRGYLGFEWFDRLSEQGVWWVSRYANKVSWQILHLCYQGDGVLDAIVYLGAHRSDQARYPVRLVQFSSKGKRYIYLTNVLDPRLLSMEEIARLYARRWDIELAFRLLKDHLGCRELWSAKWSVIQVQLWAAFILAQLFHALQMQVAADQGVDPFEVSIDLLVRLTPRWIAQGRHPRTVLRTQGYELGVIRPSTRVCIQVPFIDPSWVSPPPPEVLVPREKARHAHRKCGPRRSSSRATSPHLLE